MTVRPTLVADRYRLVELIGTGGMGRVWLARDELLDRDVAIKELVPPEWMSDDERRRLRDRALREARSAGRLNSPHVVRVYDVVSTDALAWIVMEYVPSRSLQKMIAEDGPFPPDRTARIGLDLLDALTDAHRVGVLHRDVKPHNVLIGDDGHAKLTDFGLATFLDDGSVTGPGLIVGSPQYVSPERARDGTSTVASDLWSLGATLFAAVEGHSPYARGSAMATLAALATEPPDPPVRAGPLAPVLAGLLRHRPQERLTAPEVRRLLEEVAGLERTPVAATAGGPPVVGRDKQGAGSPSGLRSAVSAFGDNRSIRRPATRPGLIAAHGAALIGAALTAFVCVYAAVKGAFRADQRIGWLIGAAIVLTVVALGALVVAAGRRYRIGRSAQLLAMHFDDAVNGDLSPSREEIEFGIAVRDALARSGEAAAADRLHGALSSARSRDFSSGASFPEFARPDDSWDEPHDEPWPEPPWARQSRRDAADG